MAKITILGVEVDADKLSEIVNITKHENPNFNSAFFGMKLEELDTTVKRLAKAGPDYSDEYLSLKKLYDGLYKINNWFMEYNYSDNFDEDKIVKVKRLIQVKAYIPNYKSLNSDTCIKLEGTGLFTIAELYIIPFNLIKMDVYCETTFEFLQQISLQTGYNLKHEFVNPSNLPEDGKLGTARPISSTHFAVLVESDSNPIIPFIQSNLRWRYVAADGSAI